MVVLELFADTPVGPWDTVTVIVVDPVIEQPVFVPVTVYVVVVAGLAVTLAPLVALRPVPGDHVYPPVAPEAVSSTLPPLQIEGALGVTDTVGPLQGV